MSLYKVLREQFGEASCEDKLHIIRHEMITNIATIVGYTALLKQEIDPHSIMQQSPDFSDYLDRLTVAGNNLRDILDALTSKHGRTEE